MTRYKNKKRKKQINWGGGEEEDNAAKYAFIGIFTGAIGAVFLYMIGREVIAMIRSSFLENKTPQQLKSDLKQTLDAVQSSTIGSLFPRSFVSDGISYIYETTGVSGKIEPTMLLGDTASFNSIIKDFNLNLDPDALDPLAEMGTDFIDLLPDDANVLEARDTVMGKNNLKEQYEQVLRSSNGISKFVSDYLSETSSIFETEDPMPDPFPNRIDQAIGIEDFQSEIDAITSKLNDIKDKLEKATDPFEIKRLEREVKRLEVKKKIEEKALHEAMLVKGKGLSAHKKKRKYHERLFIK